MKRLLPWLLALCCGASSAQVLQVYCNAANQTPCNTTTPYLGNSGDAWWLAFGKTNANANYLCGALGICLGNSGLVIGNPSGGAKGAGSINMQSCFVNGVACNSGGTPGGSAFELQYNNSGTFGGIALGTSGQPLLSSGSSGAPAFGLMGLTALQTQSADTLVCNPTGSTASLEACTLAARLNFSGTALDLSPSGVTAGSYTCTNETVDTYGRVTSAANGSCGGSSITLQTNGTNNASQTTLNLESGAGIAVANPSSGNVTVALSASIDATGPASIPSSDAAKIVLYSSSSPTSVTLAAASTTGYGSGFGFDVENIGAGVVTITPTTSTICGLSSITIAYHKGLTITSDGTNYQCSGTALGPLLVNGPKFSYTATGCTPSASTGGSTGGTITLAAGPCTQIVVTMGGGNSDTDGWHCDISDRALSGPTNWFYTWGEASSTATTATFDIPPAVGSDNSGTDQLSFVCVGLGNN